MVVIQKSSFCQKSVLLYEVQRRAGLCHTALKRSIYEGFVYSFWNKQLVEVFHNIIVDFLITLYCLQTVFKIPGFELIKNHKVIHLTLWQLWGSSFFPSRKPLKVLDVLAGRAHVSFIWAWYVFLNVRKWRARQDGTDTNVESK